MVTKDNKMKTTTALFQLPVWKQGDDLDYCIENNENLSDAFMDQAAAYEEAANLCKKMAAAASENDFEVFAETHNIEVSGNEKVISKLIKDGTLEEYEDYDEDNEEDNYDSQETD